MNNQIQAFFKRVLKYYLDQTYFAKLKVKYTELMTVFEKQSGKMEMSNPFSLQEGNFFSFHVMFNKL